MTFSDRLEDGKLGESQISKFLISKGFNILPVYELEKSEYKGPCVYTKTGRLIAPDILAFNNEKTIWIEAKHKNAFSWHRKTQRFVTGIDLRHYKDYLRILDISPWPVWLLFLHKPGTAKDSSPGPSGLFGNELGFLSKHENHRHENWGSGGMVYWGVGSLKKIADYRGATCTH